MAAMVAELPPIFGQSLAMAPPCADKLAQNCGETTTNERKTGRWGGYPGSCIVVVIVIILTPTILLFT